MKKTFVQAGPIFLHDGYKARFKRTWQKILKFMKRKVANILKYVLPNQLLKRTRVLQTKSANHYKGQIILLLGLHLIVVS